MPDLPQDTPWVCNVCGKVIFRQHQLLKVLRLWDLGEYQADAFLITNVDLSALRRYDTSLHEGWYCCRFMVMRMVVDKFGTGDRLVVYSDSVHPVTGDDRALDSRPGAIQLTTDDFDAVIASPQVAADLAVVKLGAIWCPPCRLMDAAVASIHEAGGLQGVHFFDIDVDHQPSLSDRYPNMSIPYTVLYHGGRRLPIVSAPVHLLDGGILGGLGSAALISLLTEAREQVAAGCSAVSL